MNFTFLQERGRLGFPRLTGIGPLVDSEIKPAHDAEPGTYTFNDLEFYQGKTADDTEMFLREILRAEKPLDAMFEYKMFAFEEIVVPNGFIPTLANYVGEDPDEIEDMVIGGTFPEDDLDALFGGPKDDLELVANKVRGDVVRVNDIKDQIEDNLEYFPPTFEREKSTLDGAHRTAALFNILGPEKKIYAWELTNAEEIGVQ